MKTRLVRHHNVMRLSIALPFMLWALIPSGCCEILPYLCLRDIEGLRSDVVFHRSGGFAGTGEEIVVSTNGLLRITGRLFGDTVRAVNPEEASQLLNLLQDWDALDAHPEPDGCADIFTYSITYAGRTISWDDCSSSVQPQLDSLAEFLLNL